MSKLALAIVNIIIIIIFTHADVVNAQSWEVSTPKNPVEPP